MIGVPSSLYSGYGPKASVLKRQATSSLLKFDGIDLIERRVARELQVGAVGRPFAVLGRRLALARELLRGRGADEHLPEDFGDGIDEPAQGQHQHRHGYEEFSRHRFTPQLVFIFIDARKLAGVHRDDFRAAGTIAISSFTRKPRDARWKARRARPTLLDDRVFHGLTFASSHLP